MWKQRARSEWLQEGDMNSTFSSAKATQMRARKLITNIKRADRTSADDNHAIQAEFANYFRCLYQDANTDNTRDWNEVLSAVPHKISNENKALLLEPYTEEEVTHVVFQMHPTTAPGSDGYSAMF